MSSACVCHVEGEFCFYCEVYSPVSEENDRLHAEVVRLQTEIARLHEALNTIMHVSMWDGISHELDRCYTIARDALKEVSADASR